MIPSTWFALTRMDPGDDEPGPSDQQGHELSEEALTESRTLIVLAPSPACPAHQQ